MVPKLSPRDPQCMQVFVLPKIEIPNFNELLHPLHYFIYLKSEIATSTPKELLIQNAQYCKLFLLHKKRGNLSAEIEDSICF